LTCAAGPSKIGACYGPRAAAGGYGSHALNLTLAAGRESKEEPMMETAMRWPLAVLLLTWAGAAFARAADPAPLPPAQQAAAEIPLYPGAAPGSEQWDWSERSVADKAGRPVVTDVVRPVLLHYPADKGKAVGTAMIVAPGGGFRALMMSYEGVDVARRLNAMGVDAFVLKYRLTHDGPGAPARQAVIQLAADDGRQAVRLVRARAGAFGYRPDRVGMIGFSAGGLVTAEALFGPAATRPDFAAVIYGAPQGVQEVPSPAPPLFLAVAADDALAVGRTLDLFTAYRKGKGLAELHVFQMGAHGFVNKGGGADHFLDRLEEWLAANKLLAKSSGQPAAAEEQGAAGTWKLTYNPGDGEHDATLTVTRNKSGLRGKFADGDRTFEVTRIEFKDGKLVFATRTEREGEKAAATFEGKVKGDALEGEARWEYQGMQGSFRFEAKRQATGQGPPKAGPE
jgi:acetyl esterase/lipase